MSSERIYFPNIASFGGTTFVLSLYNAQARHITVPNVILGLALGYGGLAQIIAGIEEWACGNTFGSTAFTSYGSFWISFGVLYIPQFEVLTAYAGKGHMLDDALAIYLTMWAIITFIFLLGTFRSSVALFLVFFFLEITFWLLAAGHYTGHKTVTKAGGGMGVVTAFTAFYTALAGLREYHILPSSLTLSHPRDFLDPHPHWRPFAQVRGGPITRFQPSNCVINRSETYISQEKCWVYDGIILCLSRVPEPLPLFLRAPDSLVTDPSPSPVANGRRRLLMWSFAASNASWNSKRSHH